MDIAADDSLDLIRADLAAKPDGVLEEVAVRRDVPMRAVPDALPLGGPLRAERCAAIDFVDRPFFGRRSLSLQFVTATAG